MNDGCYVNIEHGSVPHGCHKVPQSQLLPLEIHEYMLKLKIGLNQPVTKLKQMWKERKGSSSYQFRKENGKRQVGISTEEMRTTLGTFNNRVPELKARATVQSRTRPLPEFRIVLIGSPGAGKTTLLGVLTLGERDNGRGRSRLNVTLHRHENQSGITSSISREVLGFDAEGNLLTNRECPTVADLCERAVRLITFIDLAGHPKYLKTTVYGLTSQAPHAALLVVDAERGLDTVASEHYELAALLNLPVIAVLNRADQASASLLSRSLNQVKSIIAGGDDTMHLKSYWSPAPTFIVSCVTGLGLDELVHFLRELPFTALNGELENLPTEFCIQDTFEVSHIGTVVAGFLVGGSVTKGEKLHAGPLNDGCSFPVRVFSVQRHQQECHVIWAGEIATLGVVSPQPLRQGMLITNSALTSACWAFEARILKQPQPFPTTATLYCIVYLGHHVRQSCRISPVTSLRADTLSFQFLRAPEVVRTGDRVVVWEPVVKLLASVAALLPTLPSNC